MKPAKPYVDAALALHRSHPHAPTAEVLDLALQGIDRAALDFNLDGHPPSPFAMMVATVHDNTGLSTEDWGLLRNPRIDPKLAAGLLEIWRERVWPRFLVGQQN